MDDLNIRDASAAEETPPEEKEAELQAPSLDGLSEEEAKKFKEIFDRFIASYKEKAPDVSLEDWLTECFEKELPNIGSEEARKLSQETITTVKKYDSDLNDLKAAASKGKSSESWLAGKLQEASAGMAVAEYGRKLAQVDSALQLSNEQMQRTILRMDGEVSQALNLDGFIAEQTHVNRFNQMAALKGEAYRAEVCLPDGAYKKNSVDLVIKDASGKIVQKYQVKYGADAKTTIEMLKRGHYDNQRILVPPDQVAEVQAAFPGKTVVSEIGGGDIPISSEAVSKETVKQLQEEAQKKGILPEDTWNTYNTREVALQLGKNAAVAGIQGAAIGTGFYLAQKLFSGEDIDPDETIQNALETGADAGIKSATAGALTVASRGGGPLSKVIPAGTAVGTIANIACVAVENVKILGKVATGDLTLTEGLDQMGQTTTAMCCGLTCMTGGAAVGAAALSWLPFVGPVVGGLVGGVLGYTAGSKVGQTIFNGAKKVAKGVFNVAKSVGRAVIDTGRKIVERVGDFIDSLLPW